MEILLAMDAKVQYDKASPEDPPVHCILVLDLAPVHSSAETMGKLRRHGHGHLCSVVAGATSHLHSCDVGCFRSLKGALANACARTMAQLLLNGNARHAPMSQMRKNLCL